MVNITPLDKKIQLLIEKDTETRDRAQREYEAAQSRLDRHGSFSYRYDLKKKSFSDLNDNELRIYNRECPGVVSLDREKIDPPATDAARKNGWDNGRVFYQHFRDTPLHAYLESLVAECWRLDKKKEKSVKWGLYK